MAETPVEIDSSCPLIFPNAADVNDDLPSESKLSEIAQYKILDASGNAVPFCSLYEGANGEKKASKVLVIFTRFAFCPSCQNYITYVSQGLPSPAELAKLPIPISVAIVGCFSSSLIPFYAKETSCPYPVYTDPTLRIYAALELTRTNKRDAELPEYIQHRSLVTSFLGGVGLVAKKIGSKDVLNGGPSDQVGADFLWESGKLVWCHRMTSTTDHTSLKKLKELLELPEG